MIKIPQKAFLLLFPLLSLPSALHGQDIPAVTSPPVYHGFSLPDVAGTLSYALTGSESIRTGYTGSGTIYSSTISGNVAYLSNGNVRPFSMIYSGGYLYTNSAGEPSSFFHNLSLSQVLNTRSWNFVLSDSVRYLPEAPSTGLSGIPGVGDIGIPPPITSPDPGQAILSRFSQRVSNQTALSASRKITGSTSFQGSGTYFIQRFLTGFGLDTNQLFGSGSVTHRIDALRSINSSYTYSWSTYPDSDFSFSSQGVNVGYTAKLNRKMSLNVSAGPQFTNSSTAQAANGSTSINFQGSASLQYKAEHSTMSVDYSRGVQSGAGVVQGSLADDLNFGYSHALGRSASFSSNLAYSHNESISILTTIPFSLSTISAGAQASRALGRYFSTYLSYTAQQQSLGGSAKTSFGFSGLSNVVAVGVSYSPRPVHFGHQ